MVGEMAPASLIAWMDGCTHAYTRASVHHGSHIRTHISRLYTVDDRTGIVFEVAGTDPDPPSSAKDKGMCVDRIHTGVSALARSLLCASLACPRLSIHSYAHPLPCMHVLTCSTAKDEEEEEKLKPVVVPRWIVMEGDGL